MDNRPPEFWQYVAAGIAVAVSLSIAAMNVAWAWNLEHGLFRIAMLAGSIVADLGAVVFMFGMLSCHHKGEMGRAVGAFMLWAAFGFCEVWGVSHWMITNSHKLDAPVAQSVDVANSASKDMEEARKYLSIVNATILRQDDEDKLKKLRKERAETEAKIERLRPRASTAGIVETGNPVSGVEWWVAGAAWVISQVIWFVAFGSHGRPTERSTIALNQSTNREPIVVDHVPIRPQPVDQPVQPLLNQPAPAPTLGLPQPVEDEEKPVVDQPAPTSNQPVQPASQPVTRSRPELVVCNQPSVDHEPGLDDFQTRVMGLMSAGFSERQIVDRLSSTRHAVRKAKAAVEDHQVKERRRNERS